MKFVKVKGFEKKVAFLGVFYMCVFGESNLTVYNKCLEDLFQQKLINCSKVVFCIVPPTRGIEGGSFPLKYLQRRLFNIRTNKEFCHCEESSTWKSHLSFHLYF